MLRLEYDIRVTFPDTADRDDTLIAVSDFIAKTPTLGYVPYKLEKTDEYTLHLRFIDKSRADSNLLESGIIIGILYAFSNLYLGLIEPDNRD